MSTIPFALFLQENWSQKGDIICLIPSSDNKNKIHTILLQRRITYTGKYLIYLNYYKTLEKVAF